MKITVATALLSTTLALIALPAQAGLGDTLRDSASKLGGGSSAASESSGSGLGSLVGGAGGSAGGLGALGGMAGSGTASNAAGVITYCMKNNYLNANKAAQVKDQLLGKIGLGKKEEPKDQGYKDGLMGVIKGDGGKSFNMDKIKGDLKEKACDMVLDNAKSFL
ncbi:DUF2501 domain-containing protein [Comamonas sp. GB3 AK4-5]|uniref:DUF2501 domain-containing protein n=1 Tax=Comamonas sp. GB3 AK4-5 TaxID=3231487 RepID=UPI00351F5348